MFVFSVFRYFFYFLYVKVLICNFWLIGAVFDLRQVFSELGKEVNAVLIFFYIYMLLFFIKRKFLLLII